MVGDDFLYSEDDEVMHRSLGCLLYLQFDVVDEKISNTAGETLWWQTIGTFH